MTLKQLDRAIDFAHVFLGAVLGALLIWIILFIPPVPHAVIHQAACIPFPGVP